ncbi:MAG: ATP-binding protein, partial [Bacteroidota bacterium]
IRYVDQTNQDFTAFLLGIKYEDFSATYSGKHKGKTFGELYDAFNQINRKFLDIRSEKEAHYQYLQTIVENVDVGLLCLDEDDKVVLMNKKLQQMLNKPYLIDIYYLQQVDDHLFEVVKNLQQGDRELVKLTVKEQLLQLSVQAVEFKLQGKPFKLVSLQNIQNELEAQELISWQKLIRILTHEIMNSITPIASLATTVSDMLKEEKGTLSSESLEDIQEAIKAINRRSEGLLRFTETYRNLTRIPPPSFELVDANDLLQRMMTLFKPKLQKDGLEFRLQHPDHVLYIQADPGLIEQVLVNLIKNAAEAVKDKEGGYVSLSLQKQRDGRTQIQVADNGDGIEEEMLDKIFMPFFTTKQEGSGIGLSLSRQIMQTHKGSINVQSEKGEGTVFTLML